MFIQREMLIKLCQDSDLVHYRKAQWIFTKYLLCQKETNHTLIEPKRNENKTLLVNVGNLMKLNRLPVPKEEVQMTKVNQKCLPTFQLI